MHLLNWRNPEVKRGGKVVSITINTPGVYDGLDIEDLTLAKTQPLVTLGTTGLVHIRGSRLKTTGACFWDNSAAGRKLKLENSILENAPAVAGNLGPGRIVDVDRFHTLVVLKCDLRNHGGIKLAGAGGTAVNTVIISENRSLNVVSMMGDGNGGFQNPSAGATTNNAVVEQRQFVQLTGLVAATGPGQPGIQKFQCDWNECVNIRGQSQAGDVFSGSELLGTVAIPIEMNDNLVDGNYGYHQYSVPDATGSYLAWQASPAGNRLTFSGSGMMSEAPSGSGTYMHRRRNVIIATTNGGIYLYNLQTNCIIEANRLVSSGLAPDGTQLTGARTPGIYASVPDASCSALTNYVTWMRATAENNPLQRGDLGIGIMTQSGNGPGGSTTITLADEQAARDFWLAKKRAAGIYPGSSWLASPGGY